MRAGLMGLAVKPASGGTQDIVWTGIENATATGNDIQKTAGSNGDNDAGGYSTQTIASGDVTFTFKLTGGSANTDVIALSNDHDPSFAITSLDFAWRIAGSTITGYKNNVVVNYELETSHSEVITGVSAGHHYKAYYRDKAGQVVASSDGTLS
jgi:hypothetical protein